MLGWSLQSHASDQHSSEQHQKSLSHPPSHLHNKILDLLAMFPLVTTLLDNEEDQISGDQQACQILLQERCKRLVTMRCDSLKSFNPGLSNVWLKSYRN